jgi:hypothetical protein
VESAALRPTCSHSYVFAAKKNRQGFCFFPVYSGIDLRNDGIDQFRVEFEWVGSRTVTSS